MAVVSFRLSLHKERPTLCGGRFRAKLCLNGLGFAVDFFFYLSRMGVVCFYLAEMGVTVCCRASRFNAHFSVINYCFEFVIHLESCKFPLFIHCI